MSLFIYDLINKAEINPNALNAGESISISGAGVIAVNGISGLVTILANNGISATVNGNNLLISGTQYYPLTNPSGYITGVSTDFASIQTLVGHSLDYSIIAGGSAIIGDGSEIGNLDWNNVNLNVPLTNIGNILNGNAADIAQFSDGSQNFVGNGVGLNNLDFNNISSNIPVTNVGNPINGGTVADSSYVDSAINDTTTFLEGLLINGSIDFRGNSFFVGDYGLTNDGTLSANLINAENLNLDGGDIDNAGNINASIFIGNGSQITNLNWNAFSNMPPVSVDGINGISGNLYSSNYIDKHFPTFSGSSGIFVGINSIFQNKQGPSKLNIVCFGDSITFGIGSTAPLSYPAVLQYLGIGQGGATVFNMGMTQQTTSQCYGNYANFNTYTITGNSTSGSAIITSIAGPTGSLPTGLGYAIGGSGISINSSFLYSGTSLVLTTPSTYTSTTGVRLQVAVNPTNLFGYGKYAGTYLNNYDQNFTGTAHLISPALTNVSGLFIDFLGANDYYSAGTGIGTGAAPITPFATWITEKQGLWNAARQDGYIVVALSLIPAGDNPGQGSSTSNTNRLQFNSWIASQKYNGIGTTGWDYFIDVAAALPAWPILTGNPLYANDLLHPNAQGEAAIGDSINSQLFSQIYTGSPYWTPFGIHKMPDQYLSTNIPLLNQANTYFPNGGLGGSAGTNTFYSNIVFQGSQIYSTAYNLAFRGAFGTPSSIFFQDVTGRTLCSINGPSSPGGTFSIGNNLSGAYITFPEGSSTMTLNGNWSVLGNIVATQNINCAQLNVNGNANAINVTSTNNGFGLINVNSPAGGSQMVLGYVDISQTFFGTNTAGKTYFGISGDLTFGNCLTRVGRLASISATDGSISTSGNFSQAKIFNSIIKADSNGVFVSGIAGTDYPLNTVMTPNQTATVTFNTSGISETIYDTSSSTIGSLTINLPSSSISSQILRYVTAGTATLVTVNGNISIGAAITSLAANSSIAWQATSPTGNYIRIQ